MGTQKNRPDLESLVTTSFPTNGTGYITAAIMRSFMDDFIASVFIMLTDDSDDVVEGATNLWYTLTEQQKLAFITVTQAVDLDDLVQKVAALDQAIIIKGDWDASAGTFPGSGLAQSGWAYLIDTPGTVDGVEFLVGDRIIAITDNASTGTYAGNWFKDDGTDKVTSVAGRIGAIVLAANDIAEEGDRVWMTTVAQNILGVKTFAAEAVFTAGLLGFRPPINKTASFSVTVADLNRGCALEISAATTITVDNDSDTAFPDGGEMEVYWLSDSGTNSVGFATGGTQEIISEDDLVSLKKVGSCAVLKKIRDGKWILTGGLG